MILGRTTRFVWPLQLALNEFSWAAGLVGLVAMIRGWRQRNLASFILGGYGFLASLCAHRLDSPTHSYQWKAKCSAAWGPITPSRYPPTMWPRLARYHWSVLNTLGKRNYTPRAAVTQDVVLCPAWGSGTQARCLRIPDSPGTRRPLPQRSSAFTPGSWRTTRDKGKWFAPHHRYLASQGYVVFDIQYRCHRKRHGPLNWTMSCVRCSGCATMRPNTGSTPITLP